MAALTYAHCGSTDVIGCVRLLDTTGGNASGDHDLAFQEDHGGLMNWHTIRTPVRATVCATCGAVGLFVIDPDQFAARFRAAWPEPPPGDWPPTQDKPWTGGVVARTQPSPALTAPGVVALG